MAQFRCFLQSASKYIQVSPLKNHAFAHFVSFAPFTEKLLEKWVSVCYFHLPTIHWNHHSIDYWLWPVPRPWLCSSSPCDVVNDCWIQRLFSFSFFFWCLLKKIFAPPLIPSLWLSFLLPRILAHSRKLNCCSLPCLFCPFLPSSSSQFSFRESNFPSSSAHVVPERLVQLLESRAGYLALASTMDIFYPRSPWRRAWQPTPVFLPGKFHGQRSLAS